MTPVSLSPGAGAAPGPRLFGRPGRILMTLDAVGGVWRYAMDLCARLARQEVETVFAGFGPPPTPEQVREAERIGPLVWTDAPLDWTAESEAELGDIPRRLVALAHANEVDLVHLNLPSQAAGLRLDVPVVVVSHSCVVSWFHAVQHASVPEAWRWQERRNRMGFAAADAAVAPSRSHAEMLEACYGGLGDIRVVYNCTSDGPLPRRKQPFAIAAGRWWDEGKNAAVLDAAAARSTWPIRMAGALEGPNGQAVTLTHAEYLGALPNAGLRALMAQAAICVSPSLYEPFGLSALEAATAGCALVLSDIPTYRELWDGAALFADPADPRAFADAIGRLAADEALRRRLCGLAAARATRFSPEAQGEAMLRVYADALHAAHARQRLVG
jgi:glycosyltransferase involved in cell wall biosynthesis